MVNVIEAAAVRVELRDATRRQQLLKDITLCVSEGEWMAIVGRNGSGKSTLARVLCGLTPISGGHLRINGKSDVQEFHRDVQIVFQNPEAQIVGETPLEDVLFSLESAGRYHAAATDATDPASEAITWLRRLGLAQVAENSVRTLSGGQKQRLCIASCLALGARILIFDESTSMLDEGGRQDVLKLMTTLQHNGHTILHITQNPADVLLANRVYVLENGMNVFDGDVRDYFYSQPGHTPVDAGTDVQAAYARCGLAAPYFVQVCEAWRRATGMWQARPLTYAEWQKQWVTV